MRSILSLVVVSLLVGCSTTVPVTAKFPEPPGKQATLKCPQLIKLEDDPKLSDVAKTVADNYTTYYSCSIKLDTWIEWYELQRKIYEKTND